MNQFEISEKSWHYKLIVKFKALDIEDSNKVDGCQYFWTVFGLVLLGSLFAALFTVAGVMFLLLLSLLFAPLFVHEQDLVTGIQSIGALIWFITFYIAHREISLRPKTFPKLNRVIWQGKPKVKKEKNATNLLFAFLQARKEKYCPIFTIKREEK